VTSLTYCHQAKGLLNELSEAIRELVKLHEEQFQSLVGGDLDSARFDPLFHIWLMSVRRG
jgi:hypothetical protein